MAPIYLGEEEPTGPPSQLLTPAEYPAVVGGTKVKESKEGNEYVELEFVFDVPQGGKPRHLWTNLNFPPDGVKPADWTEKQKAVVNILKRRLRGLGLPYKGSDYPEGLTPTTIAAAALGCKAIIDVRTEKRTDWPDRSAIFEVIPWDADAPVVATSTSGEDEDLPF